MQTMKIIVKPISREILNQKGAMNELAAEYAEAMMEQTDLFADLLKQHSTAAQKRYN